MHRLRQADLRDLPRRTRRLPELPSRSQGRGGHRYAPARFPAQVPPARRAARACAARATVAAPSDPVESRALVALGYPLWPLGADLAARPQAIAQPATPSVPGARLQRRLLRASGALLSLIAQVPFIGFSAWVLRAAARAALSDRQRLLRHQDLERRRRPRSGRQRSWIDDRIPHGASTTIL